MKLIKKISATPVQENTGAIIDSLNTSDDKHTNAPSINAIKTYIDNEINNVETDFTNTQTGTITTTKSDINFTLKFKRNMNVVTVNVTMNVPATKKSAANWIQIENLMPVWAKTNETNGNENLVLDTSINFSSMSPGASAVTFSDVGRVSLIKDSGGSEYDFMYVYGQADNSSTPDGNKLTFTLKYIVV